MAQITSWDDLCFPVYSQPMSQLLSQSHHIIRSRQQAIIVEPPAGSSLSTGDNEGEVVSPQEGYTPWPYIVAIQGPDYEFIPNSLIREVADAVLSKAGIGYQVRGQQYGLAEFRYQLILEEKPVSIGNPKDVIYAAINIANNYLANGHLTISGRALEQKRMIYADRSQTIPAFSVYRKICDNGLWGWKDVDEIQYLESLSRGEKARKNWRKQLLSRRQIESPAELKAGEELSHQVSSETTRLTDHKKVRHSKGAAQQARQLLETILSEIVAQYDLFTKSPAIRIYNVMYDQKITNIANRIEAVMAATTSQEMPRKLETRVFERVITEMKELGEKVANDWLIYNAFNQQIWKNSLKQDVYYREKADAKIFEFLLSS